MSENAKKAAFNWAKIVAVLAALLSGIYGSTGAISSGQNIDTIFLQINEKLVPKLQEQLNKLYRENRELSERLVRIETKLELLYHTKSTAGVRHAPPKGDARFIKSEIVPKPVVQLPRIQRRSK